MKNDDNQTSNSLSIVTKVPRQFLHTYVINIPHFSFLIFLPVLSCKHSGNALESKHVTYS